MWNGYFGDSYSIGQRRNMKKIYYFKEINFKMYSNNFSISFDFLFISSDLTIHIKYRNYLFLEENSLRAKT